jgi:hypothetical protein
MKQLLSKLLKIAAWPFAWLCINGLDPVAAAVQGIAGLLRFRRLAKRILEFRLAQRKEFDALVVRLCEKRLRLYAGHVVSWCSQQGCFLPSGIQDRVYAWLVNSIASDAAAAAEMAALMALPIAAGTLSVRVKAFDKHITPHLHAACCEFGQIPLVVEEV